MVSIAHIVRKLLRNRPFVQEGLSRGIINNAAFAEELKPEIEKELGREIGFSAINMAIRRYGEELQENVKETKNIQFVSNVRLEDGLIEITIERTEKSYAKIIKLYEQIESGDIFTVTQGLSEITITSHKKYEKFIDTLFPQLKNKLTKLSAVTIRLSKNALIEPGTIYLSSRALLWQNINIVEVVSTLTELTFIINENDGTLAFSVLKRVSEEGR